MNNCAVELIEREIQKKEKQVAVIDEQIGPKASSDYFNLMREAQQKLADKEQGRISEKSFMDFIAGAAETEKKCLRLMDPKVIQRLSDKKYKLMDDIHSLRYSLGRLL